MRFRKKPVIVEAVKFSALDYLAGKKIPGVEMRSSSEENIRFYIQTLEGEMEVTPGDWIVTGIKGEKYPVKPDIFLETYEPI